MPGGFTAQPEQRRGRLDEPPAAGAVPRSLSVSDCAHHACQSLMLCLYSKRRPIPSNWQSSFFFWGGDWQYSVLLRAQAFRRSASPQQTQAEYARIYVMDTRAWSSKCLSLKQNIIFGCARMFGWQQYFSFFNKNIIGTTEKSEKGWKKTNERAKYATRILPVRLFFFEFWILHSFSRYVDTVNWAHL